MAARCWRSVDIPDWLCNRLDIAWIDNKAARFVAIKGSSQSFSMVALCRVLQQIELERPSSIWLERVASFSNPSDMPSRDQMELAAKLFNARVTEELRVPDQLVNAITSLHGNPHATLNALFQGGRRTAQRSRYRYLEVLRASAVWTAYLACNWRRIQVFDIIAEDGSGTILGVKNLCAIGWTECDAWWRRVGKQFLRCLSDHEVATATAAPLSGAAPAPPLTWEGLVVARILRSWWAVDSGLIVDLWHCFYDVIILPTMGAMRMLMLTLMLLRWECREP